MHRKLRKIYIVYKIAIFTYLVHILVLREGAINWLRGGVPEKWGGCLPK